MLIIGCDYHPSMQQIAWVDIGTGECGERRLRHCEEAEQFYRELKKKGVSVRVGIEAPGTRVGSSVYWASSTTSYGWGIRRRFEPSECASSGAIAWMPSTY